MHCFITTAALIKSWFPTRCTALLHAVQGHNKLRLVQALPGCIIIGLKGCQDINELFCKKPVLTWSSIRLMRGEIVTHGLCSTRGGT